MVMEITGLIIQIPKEELQDMLYLDKETMVEVDGIQVLDIQVVEVEVLVVLV